MFFDCVWNCVHQSVRPIPRTAEGRVTGPAARITYDFQDTLGCLAFSRRPFHADLNHEDGVEALATAIFEHRHDLVIQEMAEIVHGQLWI